MDKNLSYPSQQHTYDELLAMVEKRRPEVARFEQFLRTETNWQQAPASTRFHLAEEGGLVRHSLNVTNTLLVLREALSPDIPRESCVIVGLYHDVGKVGMPGKPLYLPLSPASDAWQRGRRYTVNRELVYMDLATRSLYLVSRYIPLTEEEVQAIRYHDGQYIEENRSVAHRETPLTRLLQYADNWSGGVLEDRPTQ